MILPSPSETSKSLPANSRPPPPPIHPSLQYGIPLITPPAYQEAEKPKGPITYTFSPLPYNSMLLIPSSTVGDSSHSYHISVSLNCFTPSSYITVVRRGSSENGEYVGDFEMGLTSPKKPGTVCIRGNEYFIGDVLDSKLFRSNWTWKTLDKSISLFWDDYLGNGSITCFCSKERTTANLLAKFVPPTHPRRAGRPLELTHLEVYPDGHELFDDILMSVLIIERLRTTPAV